MSLNPALGSNGRISSHCNPVDGHGVPVPHCGVVLEMSEWSRPAERVGRHSEAPAPTAIQAISELFTDSSLNDLAAAAMRVSACARGMGGLLSPFLTL